MARKKTVNLPTKIQDAQLKPNSRVDWIKLKDFRVDPNAQRKLRPRWVQYLAENFDPDKFGIPVVSVREGGDVYIDDGQHRIESLRQLGWSGDQMIQCEIFDDGTQAQSASLFLSRNDKKNVTTFDKFRIRYTAGDKAVIAIYKIVSDADLAIEPGGRKIGAVSAVNAMERIYTGNGISSACGPQALSSALGAISLAWGREGPNFQGVVLEAVGMFFIKYLKKAQPSRLASVLKKIGGGAAGLVELGRSIRDIRGGSLVDATASVIVERYNRGLRSGKLPSWYKG